MSQIVNVHLLPSHVTAEQLAESTVVVIDVLRASTTIIEALAAGARSVIPCLEVDEARDIARQHGDIALLGGERHGLKIDGFDLSNSPADYTHEVVSSKTIVFTTTNGTKAMMLGRQAARLMIGSFVNLSAVCRELRGASRIDLLCAGTAGQITHEDVLFAGAVVDELNQNENADLSLNDEARIATSAWQTAAAMHLTGTSLAELLSQSQGGQNLTSIGLSSDIELAAQIDKFDIVPELDIAQWRIHLP